YRPAKPAPITTTSTPVVMAGDATSRRRGCAAAVPLGETHRRRGLSPDAKLWLMLTDTARLAGKVVLITGGARGLGAAFARYIVGGGGRVEIGDVLDDEGTRLAADHGDAGRYVHLDVTDTDDWAAAVQTALTGFGALTGLVNTAGAATGHAIRHRHRRLGGRRADRAHRVRRSDRAGRQRRGVDRAVHRAGPRRALPRRAGGQPGGRVQRNPGRDRPDARGRRRLDRQHLLGGRADR